MYQAPLAMQLPPLLPYGMPVGRPQYAPPRVCSLHLSEWLSLRVRGHDQLRGRSTWRTCRKQGGGQGQPYGRGRGLESGQGGGPPRMPMPPALAVQQAYQQQVFMPPGRPSPPRQQQQQQQQQMLVQQQQQQQYFMQQQLMAQQQQQQQMVSPLLAGADCVPASFTVWRQLQCLGTRSTTWLCATQAMRGMRPDWGQTAAGMPMVVPPQGLSGNRPGVQWYMPPPPGSEAGVAYATLRKISETFNAARAS